MANEELDQLRIRVHEDAALADRLHRIEPERFVDEVARVAAELGISVSGANVQQAIAHGRQAWIMRWIL